MMGPQAAEWTVLGAGAILPQPDRGCSGYALSPHAGGQVTLFDCGPGSLRMLAQTGIELAEVRRVVLSHFHPDHCLDVFALLFARANPNFDAPALEIIGPVGARELVAGPPGRLARWLPSTGVSVHEVTPDRDGQAHWSGDDLELIGAPTEHTKESLAWRANTPLDSVTYTGDACEVPAIAELAAGCDLFVSECSFTDEEATPNHLSPSSAARLATRAGVGELLLSHFYPGNDPDAAVARAGEVFGGPVRAARDGTRLSVGAG